ncbi:MAG: flippase-like domain-containing protein, partial [Actinobacteria bacterium]|nr:flippase-like domain-containing protein [Actinomycetota bacterium]
MSWKRAMVPVAGTAVLAVSLVLLLPLLDLSLLSAAWANAAKAPGALIAVLALYLGAFLLRSFLWTRVLPGLSFSHALAALHVSLGGNHVLPLRLGEALRVSSVVRRAGVGFAPATASTIMLRAADILAVGTLAAALGPRIVGSVVGGHMWLL